MNIRPRLIRCLGLFALAACNHNEQAKVNITPTSIYNIDTVRAAIASGNAHQAVWEKKLSEAAFLYKSKRRYGAAVDTLRNVIFSAPSARAYYELGSAYLEAKDYHHAARALGIAEQLQYAPLANVLFKLAAAYANCPDGEDLPLYGEAKTISQMTLHYMQLAIQTGLANPERFLKDPAFAKFNEAYHQQFRDTYNEAVEGGNDPMTDSPWKNFLGEFNTLSLPLKLDTQWLWSHPFTANDNIGYAFERFVPEMQDNKFSRESFSSYYYVGKCKSDSSFNLVIYAISDGSDEESGGDENQTPTGSKVNTDPTSFYLVSYTSQGVIIDKILICGQNAFDQPYRTATINTNGTFSIVDVDVLYNGDPKTNGYPASQIDALRPQASLVYRISPSGKFEKIENAALSMR